MKISETEKWCAKHRKIPHPLRVESRLKLTKIIMSGVLSALVDLGWFTMFGFVQNKCDTLSSDPGVVGGMSYSQTREETLRTHVQINNPAAVQNKNFKFSKPTNKSTFIACAILVYAYLDPHWCYGVNALYWDSPGAIYGRRLEQLLRNPCCMKLILQK